MSRGITLPGGFPSDNSPEEKKADLPSPSRTPTRAFIANKTSGGKVDTRGVQLIPCDTNKAGSEGFGSPLRKSLHRTGKARGTLRLGP